MTCEEKLKELNVVKIERPVKYETIYERAEEEKKEILNEAEKEYLKAVIKPFKDKIKYIEIISSVSYKKEYLKVCIEDDYMEDFIEFPYFKEDVMYKGMKRNKEYTLKELELDDEN